MLHLVVTLTGCVREETLNRQVWNLVRNSMLQNGNSSRMEIQVHERHDCAMVAHRINSREGADARDLTRNTACGKNSWVIDVTWWSLRHLQWPPQADRRRANASCSIATRQPITSTVPATSKLCKQSRRALLLPTPPTSPSRLPLFQDARARAGASNHLVPSILAPSPSSATPATRQGDILLHRDPSIFDSAPFHHHPLAPDRARAQPERPRRTAVYNGSGLAAGQ